MRLFPPPLLALALALLAPTLAAAQTCPDGRAPAPTLGIGVFHCLGGGCGLDVRTARGPAHDFPTEPRVWRLDPRGPAAGRLREGDFITSVDGALVTTPEGGRRLARLREGRAVRLGVRRGGEEMTVRVVPAMGCGAPRLVVGASPERAAGGRDAGRWPAAERPPMRFGMQIECGECGWRREGEGWVFHSATSLRVKSVDPGSPAGRAGIREGDVILALHGGAFRETGGVVLFRTLRADRAVRIVYLRDGRAHDVRVVPQILRPDEP